MENIESFWVLVIRFLVLLCALKLVSFVEAENGSFGGSGYIGGGKETEQLCNADLSSFLLPPYGNLSNMICRPIWNTFVLRASLFSS